MASYCRQYTGAAPYEVSLNFPLRHHCYFIRQTYLHIGKSFEGAGGKDPGSESGSVVSALSFLPGPCQEPRAGPGSAHTQNIGMGDSVLPLEAHLTPKQRPGTTMILFRGG